MVHNQEELMGVEAVVSDRGPNPTATEKHSVPAVKTVGTRGDAGEDAVSAAVVPAQAVQGVNSTEVSSAASTSLSPEIGEWLAKERTVKTFSGAGSSAKRENIRVVAMDFKYPLVRVVERLQAGVAMGADEPVLDLEVVKGVKVVGSMKGHGLQLLRGR